MRKKKRNGDIGYRIAALIGSLLLICSLAACGSGSASLVGKWYNEKGKCLDIRSDGSWKLEDSYGTGTWKKLDDGIFEFTDFYGDTQESAINEDESGQYIDFGYYGDFYKNAAPTSGSTTAMLEGTVESAVKLEKKIVIKNRGDFSEGRAWVGVEIDDELYVSLVDENGKILYKNKDDGAGRPVSGGMTLFVTRYEKDQVLLNSDGKVLGSKSEGTFDRVLAFGGGLAFVYKDASDINAEKHLYGVLDKNGNWIVEFWEDAKAIATSNWEYFGDGVFYASRKGVLFNAYTNKSAKFDYSVTRKLCPFIDGKAYFCGSYNGTSGSYCVNTELEIEQIYVDREFDYATNSCIVFTDAEHVEFFDLNTNQMTTISKYETEQIKSVEFYDDYGIITIKGKDGENYFTLIDRQGNELFEPICGVDPIYSHERIAYKQTGITGCVIVDIYGKEISSVLAEKFSDGIFTSGLNYYNKDGEKILEEIKE